MKIIANVEKKTLRIFENERSIFRGEYGADKLELYINKQLENEYPTITALLSNGRKIGPYSTDEAYTTEIIDNVTYTKANFTLSKANGFTLSEGKMMITIWMNSINGNKQALGNITLNVINTTAFDDGDIIISGDVEGTIVNIKVELENLQSQVNTFNGRITNLEAKKFIDLGVIEESPENAQNTILNEINKAGVYTFTYNGDTYLMLVNKISETEYKQLIMYEGLSNNIKYIFRYPYYDTFRIEKYETANKEYVDEYISSFNNSLYDLEVMIQEHENKVQNIADLGTIEVSPTSKNNTVLNEVTSGIYTFNYANEQYLMIASMRSLGSKQTILVNNDGVLKYIYRYGKTSRAWTVSEKELTTNDYVDTKIADLINGAPETLDTLFEIANALQDDDNAISGLITELSKKANKTDIPTKLSQLEQDIEIGVSEEQVLDIIEENSEQVGEVRIATSDNYDVESDNEIPTSKAVAEMCKEQMQEMIVDVNWDENGEAFVELGNNIIDWSRPVFFKLFKENSGFYVTLEWKFSYGSGGSIVDPFVYCGLSGLNSQNDYSQIFNGCLFISGGIKSGVDRELTSQYYQSYVTFVNVIESISDLNKMKVYYYPVNENSPTVNAEI